MIVKKAFTLIELMVSISILTILTMASYAPYSYFQNKSKLKIATREISQVLYEWRNMAVNWSVQDSWNVSIWVYFDSRDTEKNKVKIFSYPHDIGILDINRVEWWSIKLLKTLVLKNGVEIDNIGWRDNLLFFYDSITWNLTYYNWGGWLRNTVSGEDIISINISYKNSTSENLKRNIKYFTSTNIIDY
jgi:prepilin-type N-terminal cleavage/methylation domain-containing protein